MKKAEWASRGALLVVFFILIFNTRSSVPNGRASELISENNLILSYSAIDTTLFEQGDIILRKGRNLVSDMIARAFPSGNGMSHCGILIQSEGNWSVAHTISGQISDQDGVRLSPLSEFLKGADQGQVTHVKPIFEVNRNNIVIATNHYLSLKAEFDHDFNLEDSSKLYCSEFIRCVYLEAGADDFFCYKKIGTKNVIDMATFFQKNLFKQETTSVDD